MRSDEEKFLFNRIFDDFYIFFPHGATVAELLETFAEKKIPLQFNEKEGTKVIDEECVQEIRKVVPYIQRIVEKPRSFIWSKQEKIPVETAKRINSGAIRQLIRDSNDWYARTFLTVKPKNIISDVNEETIDLYENRFIKTLIDRVISDVVERRINLENLQGKIEDQGIIDTLDNTRSQFFRFQNASDRLLKKLTKNDETTSAAGFSESVRKELDEIKTLERNLTNLRYSDFYGTLRKCRKVGNPVNKTNIIMFEANYNRCYKLWEYLNAEHKEEDFSLDEGEEKQYEEYYFAFLVFNLIASMNNGGYEEQNQPMLDYKDDLLTCSGDMLWVKGDTQIKIKVVSEEKKVVCSLLLDETKNKWDVFELYSDFTNFEGKSRSEIEDITSKMIEKLMQRDNRFPVSGKYCFVCMDINACSVSNDFGELLYRRLFNIGDNYSPQERDLGKKAFYQTGIQILSPLDVRYNFLHIQRIINAHVLRNKNNRAIPEICPICGSERVTKSHDHLDCHACGHRISLTKCANCGEKNLLWIKYIDDSALKKQEITDTLRDKPYYFQLMKYEMIMGQYAISSFRLEEERTGWKLKSICPKCGQLFGEKEDKQNKR